MATEAIKKEKIIISFGRCPAADGCNPYQLGWYGSVLATSIKTHKSPPSYIPFQISLDTMPSLEMYTTVGYTRA